MQKNFTRLRELPMKYVVGSHAVLEHMRKCPVRAPFDDCMMNYLDIVSKLILSDPQAKQYSDVMTFGFWIRKGSLNEIKSRFQGEHETVGTAEGSRIRLGRGVVFHIAPSNVPVNYAYSLVTGLLCGNKNIVRIPSKEFPQIDIINHAFEKALEREEFHCLKEFVCLVTYGHETEINDILSEMADVRVIWGGNYTIEELRKSPLKPRATEITFADRFSIAVIDAEDYMKQDNKELVARDFFNDTFLSDQNACTSPRMVVWFGEAKEEAKKVFWEHLHQYVECNYELSGVQAVNKLSSSYRLAAAMEGVEIIGGEDNLIVRVKVPRLECEFVEYMEHSGFFLEYDAQEINELVEICNDERCQTVAYLGNGLRLQRLMEYGIQGVDRIVPIGHTMDFDLFWDGYNLYESLTRSVSYTEDKR